MNTFAQLARGVSIAAAKSIDLRMMSYEYFAVFFAGAAAFGLTAFLGGVRKRGVVAAAMLNVLCGNLCIKNAAPSGAAETKSFVIRTAL